MGKDIHFFYSFGFFAFFLSLAAKKKRSWLLCVYRAVYALFCNILTINCFFGCLAGRPANVKIRQAVFAWANDYSPLQCRKNINPMSCGQKSIKIESNRSNRTFCQICCYLSDFSRSDFLISFGASTPLSNRSTQPPINCRNVARRVSTPPELNIKPIKKEVLPPPSYYYVFLICGNLFLRLLYNHVMRATLHD